MMFLLRLLVFTNLFLIPIVLHPLTICRQLIYVGHEPFPSKTLQRTSYEYSLYKLFQYPQSFFRTYPLIKQENRLQRLWNYFFFQRKNIFSKKLFYPNLLQYTTMYVTNSDLSPMIRSFVFMSLSYFLLTYFSSLVHVYRISFKRENKSLNDIRSRVKQSIESSYARWILHALFWKFLGVIISHIFYMMGVKVLMQTFFLTYEHFYHKQDRMYSSWNFFRNLQLIVRYHGWKALYTGIVSRMIYELGLTLLPRLFWWPFRWYFLRSNLQSYFRASSIELYFLQCFGENFFRCFSIYLHIFARLSTLEIISEMSQSINRKTYPLLLLIREYSLEQPWSLFMPIHLIDAKLMSNGLTIFFRQAN